MAEKHSSRITSPKLSPEAYTRSVAEHLKAFENFVPRIYSDGEGIPTMGGGIALAVTNDKKTYELLDLGELGKKINPENPYVFPEHEKALLTQVVGILNDSTINNRAAEAQKLISAYKAGEDFEAAENNKFNFTLSDQRIVDMAKAAWTEKQAIAFGIVRGRALAKAQASSDWKNKTKEEQDAVQKDIDTYIETLRGSPLDIALTSLLYNGVVPKKTIDAMLDGDLTTMRAEILYRSNNGKNKKVLDGLARRRVGEADLATGKPDSWSEDAKARWTTFDATNEAKTYRASYPNAFPVLAPAAGQTQDPAKNEPLAPPAGATAAPQKEQNKNEKKGSFLIAPEAPSFNEAPAFNSAPSTMLANTPLSPAEREERALRSLYPTMYRDRGETLVAKQPPKPPTTLLGTPILSEEEQRDKMLRALYPTMFANA